MRMLAMVFLFLITSSSFASEHSLCQISSKNCDFYSCLEKQTACGRQGYLQKFAIPRCHAYLKAEKFSSWRLQIWYPMVRKCLQQALMELDPEMSCAGMKKAAFASHIPCYVQTGFCDLTAMDYFEYTLATGDSVLQKEVQGAARDIALICARQKSHLETFQIEN